MKIVMFVPDGDGVEIPRNMNARIVSHLLNEGTQVRIAQSKTALSYPEALKAEMKANPEMARLYVDGPLKGVRYFLSPAAEGKKLLASFQS